VKNPYYFNLPPLHFSKENNVSAYFESFLAFYYAIIIFPHPWIIRYFLKTINKQLIIFIRLVFSIFIGLFPIICQAFNIFFSELIFCHSFLPSRFLNAFQD
jgi:hypothetical protein